MVWKSDCLVYLDRIQKAVTSEWKAQDVCRILDPSDIHRVCNYVSDVRKDLRNHVSVGAHANLLSKIRGHVNNHTLTLRKNTPAFVRRPPALQLNLQWSQLKEGGFFVQQGVFLQTPTKKEIKYHKSVSDHLKPSPIESKVSATIVIG